ncbi:MAG: carboxypeptidase-like regulatory domain-containing protein [Bacteroidales bacterium]|nr:carboxypeptidase-like regulatory domain-containing protein [Bacteroidales bacterium]
MGTYHLIARDIRIIITDQKNITLPGATIKLISLSDSSSVYSITNEHGVAEFRGMKETSYATTVSFIGFETLMQKIDVSMEIYEFRFRLTEGFTTLDEVRVTARKPLIRQEGEKILFCSRSNGYQAYRKRIPFS